MSISFMTTLGPSDWLSDIGGWRCEALKIPGAQIDAVYAESTQLDSAWYKADKAHAILRWSRDHSPPNQVTVSILLEKTLSSGDVTARWKKLAILIPVITAIAGLFGGPVIDKLLFPPKTEPTEKLQPIEKYQIQGRVNLKSEGRLFEYGKIQLCIRPPDLVVYPDGWFHGEISVCLDKDKKMLEAPKLVIDSGQRDYPPVVVHLLNEGEKAPFGVPDYDVEVKHDKKEIRLRKPVEFSRPDSEGYGSNGQQVPKTVDTNSK